MMRRISCLFLRSTLVLASPPLYAQTGESPGAPATGTDPNKAQAAQRFDRGLQLFNEGDNAGALAEFKQTYALVQNPIVLFNIGLVYAAMARPVDAVDALVQVVDSATLSTEQRARAQQVLVDQRQRVGRVAVSTVPEAARIDVDGVEVAQTPLTGPLRVAEGSHVIGAVAEGYVHVRKEIIVAGNADASVRFELVRSAAKRPANLTIRSRPGSAEVVLDGHAVGLTPLPSSLSVADGEHTVELRRSGYRTERQQLELGEGATADLPFALAIDPIALERVGADFSIDSRELNPTLTLDGERLGSYTHPIRLPPGDHHVRLEAAGYLPFDAAISLTAGKPLVLRPALMPTPETRQAHDSNVRLHRTVGLVGVAGGVVAASVGVALVAIGSSHHSAAQADFDAADARVSQGQAGTGEAPCNLKGAGYAPEVCVAPRDAAQARLDKAHTEQLAGFVSIGAGAALLGTGLGFLFTGESPRRFEAGSSSKARAPHRRWALTPGPGQFGFSLRTTL